MTSPYGHQPERVDRAGVTVLAFRLPEALTKRSLACPGVPVPSLG